MLSKSVLALTDKIHRINWSLLSIIVCSSSHFSIVSESEQK